jgi:hypothetical protein
MSPPVALSAFRLKELEGHCVSLALADGSHLDNVTVVSAGRSGVTSVWLDLGGMDIFIHQSQVVDAWEPTGPRAA